MRSSGALSRSYTTWVRLSPTYRLCSNLVGRDMARGYAISSARLDLGTNGADRLEVRAAAVEDRHDVGVVEVAARGVGGLEQPGDRVVLVDDERVGLGLAQRRLHRTGLEQIGVGQQDPADVVVGQARL